MERSLVGKKIVLTRAREQSHESYEELSNLGAEVIVLPCIKVVPIDDYSDFDETIKNICFDFVIFPSANSVEMFFSRVKKLSHVNCMASAKFIAVGSRTEKKCDSMGIKIDMVPEVFSARGVIEMLGNHDLEGKNILLPSSTIARTELGEGLEKLGANVFVFPVYNIVTPDKTEIKDELEAIKKSLPDLFIFTSPSTFSNCLKILEISNAPEYFKDITVAALGNTTRDFILENKVNVNIIPDSFTMNSLSEKIVEYYKPGKTE